MALLYPWATKEYLLWEMSLGQIIMYHNLGIEQKYGKQNKKPRKMSEMSPEEVRALRDKLAAEYGDIGGTTDG
jgi:hypothetical protein